MTGYKKLCIKTVYKKLFVVHIFKTFFLKTFSKFVFIATLMVDYDCTLQMLGPDIGCIW